jgi:hypothetical protein
MLSLLLTGHVFDLNVINSIIVDLIRVTDFLARVERNSAFSQQQKIFPFDVVFSCGNTRRFMPEMAKDCGIQQYLWSGRFFPAES